MRSSLIVALVLAFGVYAEDPSLEQLSNEKRRAELIEKYNQDLIRNSEALLELYRQKEESKLPQKERLGVLYDRLTQASKSPQRDLPKIAEIKLEMYRIIERVGKPEIRDDTEIQILNTQHHREILLRRIKDALGDNFIISADAKNAQTAAENAKDKPVEPAVVEAAKPLLKEPSKIIIYKLTSGEIIRAVKVQNLGDNIGLKDESGAFKVIEKSNIESTETVQAP